MLDSRYDQLRLPGWAQALIQKVDLAARINQNSSLLKDFSLGEGLDCVGCGTAAETVESIMLKSKLSPQLCLKSLAKGKCCQFLPIHTIFSLGLAKGDPYYRDGEQDIMSKLETCGYRLLPLFALPERHAPLCPLYINDRCSIWSYRPAECAGHWCVHPSPEIKDEAEQIQSWLYEMEIRLSIEYLLYRGFLWHEIKCQLDLLAQLAESGVAFQVKDHQRYCPQGYDLQELYQSVSPWWSENKDGMVEQLRKEFWS